MSIVDPLFVKEGLESIKSPVVWLHKDLGQTTEHCSAMVARWTIDENILILAEKVSNSLRMVQNILNLQNPVCLAHFGHELRV